MAFTPDMAGAHERAAQLIPWLINGTLAGEEAARLRAHLAVCAHCRADFESEKRLYEAIRGDGPLVFAGEPSFGRLMARIEADDFAAPERAVSVKPEAPASVRPAAPGHLTRRSFWRSEAAIRWLTAAVVLEALGLGLGAWQWPSRGTDDAAAYVSSAPHSELAPYRTLSAPTAPHINGPLVRVVFRADLSLGELQTLLQGIGARIVDGPTQAHVYTLGFAQPISSAKALERRIEALRADKEVLFAEPAGDHPLP